MTIDRDGAQSSLADIAEAEQRTFRAVFYGISSSILILWGIVTAAGYVFSQFHPEHARIVWPALLAIGFVAMLALLRRKDRAWTPQQKELRRRLILAQIALVVFGALVVQVLGPFDARQLGAFWPLVFMVGYVLAGFWVGRFFILCGIVVAALTMAGYWWSGPWFSFWMAGVNGAALILGGLWLRYRGAFL